MTSYRCNNRVNEIDELIGSYRDSLIDESMTPIERLLTLLLIDLNSLRVEMLRKIKDD